ncbi:hypothetical protein AJ80_04081 [Polytolypa hystricis UAMH7299]|uniref:Uncharacterized protein n=1 Tax=Polytolypa hystricis (strain UAMH7299) TaxID=1447883 RepID=A0A2B7YEJ7_POLH7|nr:hypothetical protein AJ80_04081 [Polytolypa hystricis UAMH7299]
MMGIYLIIWWLIPILRRKVIPFPPKICLITCLVIDIVSLSTQAVGGGLAGAAFSKHTSTEPGTYTMVAGIFFQLVSSIICDNLLVWILYRGWHTIRHSKKLLFLAGATKQSVSYMVIRGVYRGIELLQGWRGFLITNQRFAIGLKGTMVLVSLLVFNIMGASKESVNEEGRTQ